MAATAVNARNLISGNNVHGVSLDGANTSNNTILGNRIGTDIAGTGLLANSTNGITISNGADNNAIGGTASGSTNLISANDEDGIEIDDATGTTIQGNVIGLDATVAAVLGNSQEGIELLNDTSNTLIGGTAANAGNIISGGFGEGISVGGISAGTLIQGNYVGTDITGSLDLGNASNGIYVGAAGVTVGGSSAGATNLISGNTLSGVSIAASNVVVHGNRIGTNAAGTAAVSNGTHGVWILGSASNNAIGGSGIGQRNVISGNAGDGIHVSGTGTGNSIQGNYIGTDVNGAIDLGNVGNGVYVTAAGITVGGSASTARNIISGNEGAGVRVETSADNTTVVGNYIGTDRTGSAALGNTTGGVVLYSSNNTVGGSLAGEGNLISANSGGGIRISVPGGNNQVLGNLVGTDAAGTADLGNVGYGIWVVGSGANTIGGAVASEGNVIAYNNSEGVRIDGAAATSNIVQGNYIGTDASNTLVMGNSASGVRIVNGSSDNLIGGTGAGEGNVVANNAGDGVFVVSGTGNSLIANTIHSNAGSGVDLDEDGNELTDDGVTSNDVDDPDTGANNLQNFVVLTQADLSGTDLTVTGTIDTDWASTQYRIEFFGSASGTQDTTHGEGGTYLGSTTLTTDGSADGAFTAVVLSGVALNAGDFVTATATKIDAPAMVGVNDALGLWQFIGVRRESNNLIHKYRPCEYGARPADG